MYENTLEQFYNSCPGPVQEVMNFAGAYDKVNGMLKWVAGDPQALADAGTKYASLGSQVGALGGELG